MFLWGILLMGWFTKFDVFDFFFPDVALIALEIEVDGAFERIVVDGIGKDADNLHGEFGSLVTDGVEDAEVGNFHRAYFDGSNLELTPCGRRF